MTKSLYRTDQSSSRHEITYLLVGGIEFKCQMFGMPIKPVVFARVQSHSCCVVFCIAYTCSLRVHICLYCLRSIYMCMYWCTVCCRMLTINVVVTIYLC